MHYKNRCYIKSSSILALISKFELKINFKFDWAKQQGDPLSLKNNYY